MPSLTDPASEHSGWAWDEHVVTQGQDVIYRLKGWELTATWPERSGTREVITLLGVRHLSVPVVLVQAPKRLNILSTSAVNGIAVTMRKVHDDGADEMLQHLCADLLHWYRRGTVTAHPDPSKPVPSRGWVLYPIWRQVDATGIAASREHFKSLLAQAIVLEVATGTEVLRGNTRPQQPRRPLYVDWESDEAAFTERLAALCRGAGLPLQPYIGYRSMRMPLAVVAQGLRDEIAAEGYGCVVVDSMSAAIGGSMIEDDSVNAFWDAIGILGVPVLVLAHKSDQNERLKRPRFFGSTMSENRVRVAWNVERSPGQTSVVLACFKDNNGRMGGSAQLGYRLELENRGEHETETLWSVTVQGVDPKSVAVELGENATIADRAERALREAGPMIAKDLAGAMGVSDSSIRGTLRRYPTRFAQDELGQWVTT